MQLNVANEKKIHCDSFGLLKMKRYTKEQSIFILEQYLKNNEGLAATVHKFKTILLLHAITDLVIRIGRLNVFGIFSMRFLEV